MIVKEVVYARKFIRELQTLPQSVIALAIKKEQIFRENPLHPSLRLHELHGKLAGLWTISVTSNYRIIFERMENGDILFISIGKHDLYRSL